MSKSISLYIEDTEVKLLVTNGNQVEKWATLELDSGLVSEGVILDESRVADSIKQLFKLQGISETRVTAGLSGLNSVFRVISIPEVSKNLLPEAVRNEAGRVLPMPLSQVYYSYQQIPSTKGEMRLFLAAYPKASTDAMLSTVIKAGLKPKFLDLAPLALARCVNANRAIIINAWLTFVDIIILSDRIPVVIRSLSLPVESSSAQERLSSIAEELNRTITFYNTTYPDKPLEKSTEIFISGDTTLEKESKEYLEQLGHPVRLSKPSLAYPEVFNPTQYMVNLGLALKGQNSGGDENQSSIIDFNALPGAYLPKTFNWRNVLVPVGYAVVIGFLAFGAIELVNLRKDTTLINQQNSLVQLQNSQIGDENSQLQASITAQNAKSDELSAQAQDIQGQIDQVNDNETFFTGLLDGFENDLGTSDVDIQEIVSDIPSGLHLDDMQYTSDGITLDGTSPSEDLVMTYARSLRSSGHFNSVAVLSIKASEDGTFSFKITLH